MKTIETILSGLPGNASDFVDCCNARLVSSTFEADLNRALEYGQVLVTDIETVISRLEALKLQLESEKPVDNPE